MNPKASVTNDQIASIFQVHKLGDEIEVQKITTGFTNEVYAVNDQYILKVCGDVNNERDFKREVQLYKFFKGRLPIPAVLVYDDSKTLIIKHYMIYEKIRGINLYDIWHTLDDSQRREIIRQLCSYLQVIYDTGLGTLPSDLELDHMTNWTDYMTGKIEHYLNIASKMNTLSEKTISNIKAFVKKHAENLNQQKLSLVYWDVHFDNILVEDNNVVGLLDLERTNIASTDYVLDTVKRMVDVPKKYMAEEKEYLAKQQDYIHLVEWYKEFFPELFDFNELDSRLELYAIEHNLEDLEGWPHVQHLKDDTEAILAGTYPKLSKYL